MENSERNLFSAFHGRKIVFSRPWFPSLGTENSINYAKCPSPGTENSECNSLFSVLGTSAFYSRQLCLCPFPAYSVFSPATSFPSTKWSETCTTTLILLISVSFETIWGGGCNMHFYPVLYGRKIAFFRPWFPSLGTENSIEYAKCPSPGMENSQHNS